MATIDQYKSGMAAKSVKLALEKMNMLETKLLGTELALIFEKNIEALKPIILGEKQAFELIKKARKCAVGERVCNGEFPEAPSSCAVFLGELAVAMTDAGKAKYVSRKEAMASLSEHKRNPLVASRIEGEYMEICRSWPPRCFYWNMEKHGMKCLKRRSDFVKEVTVDCETPCRRHI